MLAGFGAFQISFQLQQHQINNNVCLSFLLDLSFFTGFDRNSSHNSHNSNLVSKQKNEEYNCMQAKITFSPGLLL